MSLFGETWATITAPQATIVSGVLTLLAAVFGVVIGWWLFSGRVRDLKTAVDAANGLLADHKAKLEIALSAIMDKVAGLDDQFTTTLASLGKLGGNISDLQSATSPVDENTSSTPTASRENLREDWDAIRDTLEQCAANPALDGRRRAKYARIDRRRYLDLVNALAEDNALGTHAPSYRDAADLWMRYRNGRRTPSAEDAAKMAELRRRLAGGND